MLTLLGGGNPVEALYDQFDLFAHAGEALLIKLNVALGTMTWDVPGSVARIKPGMETFVITKHVVYMFAVLALVGGMGIWAAFVSGRTAKGAPRGLANFFEPILAFIRNEIVYPNVKDPHHHDHDHGGHGAAHKPTHAYADKLLPYFATLFFFVVGMNLIGLIPGASTPTSAITITGGLALITLSIYVVGAMVLQKPFFIGFFKNLVPKCPLALWPLLFFIELIGVFTKPFALMVRLFANMNAGHVIILSLSGLAAMAVESLHGPGYIIGGLSTLGSAAIYCLEVFVAILQAYIFTYLSAIFIGIYLSPEH